MDYTNLIERIMSAKVDEIINLKEYDLGLTSVEFDQNPLDTYIAADRGLYSWVAKRGWRCEFPMKDSQYVKQFKTLNGAKRNFINSYLKDK